LFNSLGNGDRQKEARQIRVNWICNSSSRSSCNILYAKIDASKNSNRHYHQNHPNDSFQIALAEMLSEIATSYEVFLDNSKYPGNIIFNSHQIRLSHFWFYFPISLMTVCKYWLISSSVMTGGIPLSFSNMSAFFLAIIIYLLS
jgi:hypothetical protein